MESREEIDETEQIHGLVEGLREINLDNVTELLHVDDQESEQYAKAVVEDIDHLIQGAHAVRQAINK